MLRQGVYDKNHACREHKSVTRCSAHDAKHMPSIRQGYAKHMLGMCQDEAWHLAAYAISHARQMPGVVALGCLVPHRGRPVDCLWNAGGMFVEGWWNDIGTFVGRWDAMPV